jgi:Squalene-hopene cyclase C-terminal domain
MHTLNFFKSACIIASVFICNLFFTTGKKIYHNEEMRKAQQKGIDFLKYIQRNNGAICDTINPLFETWETILAVSAIYKVNHDTNTLAVKNGLAFLRYNENSEGLICHNQKCKEVYCLETTAVYFRLLKLVGQNEKIITGLKKINSLQKPTGEWDIGNPDVTIQKDFPSVTAFVLDLLQSTGVEPVYKKEVISWLLNKQTQKGDWGSAWEYYGCPAYALWPVMKVLQNENSKETRMAKDKAVAFILAAQNKDGSWFYKDAAFQKQTSAELQTALMLSALQNAGLKNDEAILKGIDFLIKSQQNDGSWDGGYFPIPEKRYSKQEYVFATALAVEAMQNYLLNNTN